MKQEYQKIATATAIARELESYIATAKRNVFIIEDKQFPTVLSRKRQKSSFSTCNTKTMKQDRQNIRIALSVALSVAPAVAPAVAVSLVVAVSLRP